VKAIFTIGMGEFFHHRMGEFFAIGWMVIENDLHHLMPTQKGTSPLDGWVTKKFHLHPLFDGTRSLSNFFI
jgi:hypothetical protein